MRIPLTFNGADATWREDRERHSQATALKNMRGNVERDAEARHPRRGIGALDAGMDAPSAMRKPGKGAPSARRRLTANAPH